MAAGLASGGPGECAPTKAAGPEVYTRIGVRPFINCTATYTINGGAQMLPEVIATIEQAAHYHVNLDELMAKAGDRLAQLLQVEWGIVTAGAAAALTHATAGCIAGADPEKMQRLPNLAGLKDEVIMPRESRVVYDHAVRTLGVKIIEVNSPDELRAAISSHTVMIEVLGNHFGSARLDLKDVAPIARKAGIPILVDAAADYLIVPNPYIALGADLVAYSGGKIIRGPQTAACWWAAGTWCAPPGPTARRITPSGARSRSVRKRLWGCCARWKCGVRSATSRRISANGNRGMPRSAPRLRRWRAYTRKFAGPFAAGRFPRSTCHGIPARSG